jgi:hypothetical protein
MRAKSRLRQATRWRGSAASRNVGADVGHVAAEARRGCAAVVTPSPHAGQPQKKKNRVSDDAIQVGYYQCRWPSVQDSS